MRTFLEGRERLLRSKRMVDREQVQRFVAALDSLGQPGADPDAGVGAALAAAPTDPLDRDPAWPRLGHRLQDAIQSLKWR
jgi:hypothetical protein